MPLQFKIDVLAALKEKGITTYAIRKQKIMSESWDLTWERMIM